MALITYQDKVTLNENPGVAAINKVQASDMNEIKSVVNGNADYLVSTGLTVTDETLCSGLSLASNTFNSPTEVSITNSGYKPIGIIGYSITGSNHQSVNVIIIDLTASNDGSGTITFRLRNLSASATATINMTAKVLWVKI